jgi:hypothetical protein
MFRPATWCSVALLGAAVSLGWSGQNPPTQQAAEKPKARSAEAIRERLRGPFTLERGIEANTPLKEALEFLSDQLGVMVVVDGPAFKKIGVEALEDVPVRLPRMAGVSASRVLGMLTAQLNASYLVHRDVIEITVPQKTWVENWSLPGTVRDPSLTQLIDAHFPASEHRSLEDALRELSDQSGINVIVDAKVGDKAKTAVSATMSNTPLDTAVRLLADMADLKAVAIDNVMYVTTKAHAKALEAEQARRRVGEA